MELRRDTNPSQFWPSQLKPISYMFVHPSVSISPSLSPLPIHSEEERAHGGAGGLGRGRKSVVAMETTGREELGLCAGGVGAEGCLVSAWKQSLRPLHLHRTVHDKLQEAGGQEVQSEHLLRKKKAVRQ